MIYYDPYLQQLAAQTFLRFQHSSMSLVRMIPIDSSSQRLPLVNLLMLVRPFLY